MGPLPLTLNGNRYIIEFINIFTIWVEAIPKPDQSAATASCALIDCVVSRSGIPGQIHSDQGRQFESELFKEKCQVLGITKSRRTHYHPAANGNVERGNRTFKEMLRHHVYEYLDYRKYLIIVIFSIWQSKHASKRFSPADMTLGRKHKTPANLEFSAINLCSEDGSLITERMQNDNLITTFYSILTKAEQNIKLAENSYKNNHDTQMNERQFLPCDQVMKKFWLKTCLSRYLIGSRTVLENRHPVYKISDNKNLSKHYLIYHDYLYPSMNVSFTR
ncbi:Pro-Pol polyprotein [Thelohanellus kitauei]|uniref:Pro-Pol polyprotein n=1 Tax=Thelohanellus kitauei TaxID=669202 RepID=A0A0C2MT14_THEKT|nr:Pro-Pol polyprotein [Thelohanellus kitauei]